MSSSLVLPLTIRVVSKEQNSQVLPPTAQTLILPLNLLLTVRDEPQLTRWAEALGRYNSNNVAISKENNPLLAITTEAALSSLLERPPHFVEAYPGNYYQALQDNLAQITTGVFTPEEGAADLITPLNDTIVNQ